MHVTKYETIKRAYNFLDTQEIERPLWKLIYYSRYLCLATSIVVGKCQQKTLKISVGLGQK